MNESGRRIKQEPLADHAFQDFLVDQQLIIRGSLDPKRWQLTPPQKERELMEKVWGLVVKEPGYLVPGKVIAKQLYGFSDSAELAAAYHRGRDLKAHIEEPNSLYVSSIGQAVGIDYVRPAGSDSWVEPVYSLWRDIGKFVHHKVLFDRLYDHPATETSSTTVNVRYERLSERLKFKNVVIEGADFDFDRYYRLRVLDEEQKTLKGPKGIYRLAFQDWLGETGVLKYSKHIGIDLKDGEIFAKSQAQVVSLLESRARYITPLEKIRDIYYEGKPRPANWRDRLTRNLATLRGRCVDPEAIFVAKEMGWAFEVKALNLSKARLILLSRLWENPDRFVAAADMLKGSGIEHIEGAVVEIRKQLEAAGYKIGSRQGENDTEYILSKEDDLMRPEAA